jgi:hypothetical protein
MNMERGLMQSMAEVMFCKFVGLDPKTAMSDKGIDPIVVPGVGRVRVTLPHWQSPHFIIRIGDFDVMVFAEILEPRAGRLLGWAYADDLETQFGMDSFGKPS